MAVPPWFDELEAEFNAALDEAARGIRRYVVVMEAVEKKAAAAKELGAVGPEYDHAIYVGQRGQKTGERLFDTLIGGPGDDFNVMRSRFQSWDDNPTPNRKENPTGPSAGDLVRKLKF